MRCTTCWSDRRERARLGNRLVRSYGDLEPCQACKEWVYERPPPAALGPDWRERALRYREEREAERDRNEAMEAKLQAANAEIKRLMDYHATCHGGTEDQLRARAEAAEAKLTQTMTGDNWRSKALRYEAERDAALARVRELDGELQGYRDYERTGAQWILSLPAEATFNHNRRDGAAEPCTICRQAARIAELEGALRDVLETACSCQCDEAYTKRDLHAPECHADEVDGARAVLAKGQK